jgi:hypothetical protein
VQHCLLAGMQGPPKPKQYVVTTFIKRYDGVMAVATAHYHSAEHVDPPLEANETRAVVLTLGTPDRCSLREPKFPRPPPLQRHLRAEAHEALGDLSDAGQRALGFLGGDLEGVGAGPGSDPKILVLEEWEKRTLCFWTSKT